jgi:hypothetical protein
MMSEQILSQEEAFKRLEKEWDFENLLDPYRQGGTPENPVKRTWGTIIDWLINKHKFTPDIVGAGIFLVWMQIKKNGHFQPDYNPEGEPVWGSAGHKFVMSIRIICASLIQQKMSQKIFSGMAGQIESHIKTSLTADLWSNMPWWLKLFSAKWWKYRKQRKQLKKSESKK